MADDNKLSVTLSDGRVVGFTPKQKILRNYTITDGKINVTLDFRGGATRSFTVPDALLAQFAGHGAVQKLGDAATSEDNEDDALAAVDDLIARLNTGEWTAPRKSGEFAGVSVLIQALVEATGKPVEAIRTYLATKNHAEKLALRRSDRLAPIVERLEAAKAKKSTATIDTDSLFAELGDAPAPAATTKSKAA